MGTEFQQTPLIVIVGETASGKSSLALDVAERWNGEIICADSRTVYKGMDIGTAKPTKTDQAKVPHHLIDLINPDEKFSAAEFKRLANLAISDIHNRGKLPIMVGGTGLYVDALLYDYDFQPGTAERDPQNPRHLKKTTSQSATKVLRPDTLVIGLSVPEDDLIGRIVKRFEGMIRQGLEEEARVLSRDYGWNAEAMTAVGYREWQAYFTGQQDLDETKQLIITHTIQYAKRQRTWFKRNKSIQWVSTPDEALVLAEHFLAKTPGRRAHSLLQ